jgi:hypothetical protein
MKTYVKDNKLAMVTIIGDTNYVVSVFSSYEAMLSSEEPIQTHILPTPVDYQSMESLLVGWTEVERDDNTWDIV